MQRLKRRKIKTTVISRQCTESALVKPNMFSQGNAFGVCIVYYSAITMQYFVTGNRKHFCRSCWYVVCYAVLSTGLEMHRHKSQPPPSLSGELSFFFLNRLLKAKHFPSLVEAHRSHQGICELISFPDSLMRFSYHLPRILFQYFPSLFLPFFPPLAHIKN